MALPAATITAAVFSTGLLYPSLANASSSVAIGTIDLSADRTSQVPDGRSTTVITARVFDERGNAAADGTRVRFTTTAGRLDTSVAVTQSGVARVILTSADQPGEARVIAILEAAGQSVPAQITIKFTAESDTASTGTAWAHFDGSQYVGYIMDFGIIHATGKDGGARLEWRGLRLTANTIQYNVRENSFKAVGDVTLILNGVTRTYTNLVFDVTQNQGIGERIENDAPSIYFVKGAELTETPPAPGQFRPPSDVWALEDLSGAGITVVARSILLEPGARLQFRRATFYLDGNKTVSLPFHVMNLGQDSIFREQVFGLGPQGPTVDLPFYYDVRPEGVGTLHLRRGARLGTLTSSARPGWTMDMEQSYRRPNVDGVLEFYGLARSDWGARVRHGQRLDSRTAGSLYVDFPNHRDLFLSSQLSRNFNTFNMNTRLSATRTQGYRDPLTSITGKPGGDVSGNLNLETHERPLDRERKLRYVFDTNVTRQVFYGQAYVGTSGAAQGTLNSQSVGTRLLTSALPVARETTFSQTVSLAQTWAQGGLSASGVAVRGTSTLNRKMSNLGFSSLAYDYTKTPALPRLNSYLANPQHRLSYSLSLSPGEKWGLDLFGSRGLDVSQSTLNGNMQFKIGGPWRGRVAFSTSQFSGIRYQEVEYALIRNIAGRDFAVYYSTTARRFQLDLSGARF